MEYANLYCQGKDLSQVCPSHLKKDWEQACNKLKAFIRSFELAKVPLGEVCFFDLVPERFIMEFCEIKNNICEHVFANFEKPKNYDFFKDLAEVVSHIRARQLKIVPSRLKKSLSEVETRNFYKKIINLEPYIDYNMFGSVTGRLTTKPKSFPILTMHKKHRKVLEASNDWLVELDYNAAEIRTFLALAGKDPVEGDIHEWNRKNIFKDKYTRDECKKKFFQWFYGSRKNKALEKHYDREIITQKFYDGKYINTIFDRRIECEEKKAFNYVIQSTTADLVLRQMIKIHKALEGRKSEIALCLHDSVVIDLSDEDKHLLPDLIQTFSETILGPLRANVTAGRNFGKMKELNL